MSRNDQNFMVQKIPSQYMDQQMPQLDKLRGLKKELEKIAPEILRLTDKLMK